MTKKEYLEKRQEMMNSLKEIAENGSQEDFDSAKKTIEELDAKFEEEARNKAAIEALENKAPSVDHLVDTGKDPLPAQKNEKPVDMYDTKEYHEAFMDYVAHGVAIPDRFLNNDATTTTSTAGEVIPTTLLHEIVREMKSYGEIWSKVRKLNIQGGVDIPVLDVAPTATWITEANDSDEKALETADSISFMYYGLECKIAQSLISSVVSIAEFEDLFVTLAVEAIVAAIEYAVFNGTGSGQMTGILNETRIPQANTIALSEADMGKWTSWKKKVFGAMKKSYRNGEFFMAQSTFDGYIDGMVDSAGQPIGRVNYGIDGDEVYRFGGKGVTTVESDVLPDYESASEGDVIAVFGNLQNYIVNSNLEMKTVKWTDNDTNKEKTKVIMIVDGKVADPNGFLLIKKGGSGSDDSE